MSKPYCIAVIGKNFGDEGKGLATNYFSDIVGKILVVRHNGGAQSGHTVEIKEPEKRFVFHELSSGSFHHADTFWASTFFPDLYKLKEEIEEFRNVSGFAPHIYASEETKITILDDVLLNMAAETARGSFRHGSCGMGIWEATVRSDAGYGISIGELIEMTGEDLVNRLLYIRNNHTVRRMRELGIDECIAGEYRDLLSDETVIQNYAKEVTEALSLVKVVKEKELKLFLEGYDRIVFEGGQGLLLDSENEKYAPHVTASRTGIRNPIVFLSKLGWKLDEAVYVTRSYMTRHGAGPFEMECDREELGFFEEDKTNITNEFQGSIRYGRQLSLNDFFTPIKEDLNSITPRPEKVSLFVTHLNECSLSDEYMKGFDRVYRSDNRYGV